MLYIKTYLAMLASFLILDGIWLGFIAKDLYQKQLGHLLSQKVLWEPAIAFYLLYLAGIFHFCITPSGNIKNAIINGALLGLLCYATYDLTNWATLQNWPAKIVAIDLLWGMFITSSIAGIGFWVFSR